jgi:hypothetical protein
MRWRTLRPVVVATTTLLLTVPVVGVAAASTTDWSCAGNGGAASAPPTVSRVSADTALTNRWRAFGDSGGGWSNHGGWAAADGTYSVPLPDGRDAWLYNDTFLGPVNADESLPATSPFVHNTLVLAGGHGNLPLTTVTGGTHDKPLSLVGPTPTAPPTDPSGTDSYWYWNTDGIVDHGRLYVFEAKIGPTDTPPPFDFGQTGMAIATFSLPSLHLDSVTPTYGGSAVSWGVQLLRSGPWIYIYGVASSGLEKDVHLARVHAGDLLGRWEFDTGTGWSTDPAASAPLLGDVGASYSVTDVDGHYVLATTDSLLGHEIHLYTAPTPAGPFSAGQPVYSAPEAAGNLYTYNVAAHPELSGCHRLVLSYNVNSSTLGDLYSDANNNRARFVDVDFATRR